MGPMEKSDMAVVLDKITLYSLWALIFFLPFSKSIIEISIAVAAISWAFKKILSKDLRVIETPLNNLLIIFLFASTLSIINSDSRLFVLRSLFSKCLKYVILYFVVVETVNSKKKLKELFTICLISAIIVVIDCYLQYYILHFDLSRMYPSFKYAPMNGGKAWFLGFPTGPFPFPNDLSAWILIIFMPSLFILIWYPAARIYRYALGFFTLSLSHLLYLANTRSAWFAFFSAFSASLFIESNKRPIIFMLLVLILLAPFLVKDKLDDVLGFSSMQDRFYMWQVGWKIFLEHPIIGNGFNTFFSKFKEYREDENKNKRGSYAHNGYLQLAADNGIIGLLAFFILLRGAFLNALRCIKNSRDNFIRIFSLGLGCGLLAFLIHSFFDTNLQSLPLVALFWFSFSILMSAANIETCRTDDR